MLAVPHFVDFGFTVQYLFSRFSRCAAKRLLPLPLPKKRTRRRSNSKKEYKEEEEEAALVNVASCVHVHVACGHNTNKRTHALVELKCRRRCQLCLFCCCCCCSHFRRLCALCPAWLLALFRCCLSLRCALSQNLLTKLKDKHIHTQTN